MSCQVFLDCPEDFRPQAQYVLEQILATLGISYQFLPAVGEGKEGNPLLLYIQKPLERYLPKGRWSAPVAVIPFSQEALNLSEGLTRKLAESSLEEGILQLRFDLVQLVFNLISRREETENPGRDRFGRFPPELSQICQRGLLARPIVNEYLLQFLGLMRCLIQKSNSLLLRRDFWPPPSRFAVCLSHDVDFKRKWGYRKLWLEVRKALVNRNRLGGLRDICHSVAGREDPYWSLERLIEMERERGLSSSFLFSSTRTAKWDPTYSLTDSRVSSALMTLKKEGFEIGLHGSFNSCARPGQVEAEKRVLERALGDEVLGNRFHYLRFDVARSWREEEEAGLRYDMTMGYPDRLGFRAGIAFPYNPYDFRRERAMDIIALPLSISDGALLSEGDPVGALTDLLSRVKDTGGLACVLWHPHTLDSQDFPGLEGVYPAALSWIQKNQGFAAPGREIYKWWLSRKALRCIEEKGKHCRFLPKQDLDGMGIEVITGCRLRKIEVEGAGMLSCQPSQNGYHLCLEGLSGGEEIVLSLID